MKTPHLPMSRRDVLRLAAAGLLTTPRVPWFQVLAADAARQVKQPKACILLWMDGGPSQAHTFDPKPGGEYQSIATAVPGVRVCDCLPQVAALMKDVALLRGMSTAEGEHYRAKYLMHTGYPRVGAFEHPALGCIAASELGTRDQTLPNFVTIDAGYDFRNDGGRFYRSVPAYLGVRYTPLAVTDPGKGLENLGGAEDAEFAAQLELLRRSERRSRGEPAAPAEQARRDAFERALTLMTSARSRAFRLDQEPPPVRDRYGAHKFGQACLVARRLVEAGISFVEVFNRGWDDHEKAGERVRVRCQWMDAAMATLITDLKDRGLLDSTLVIWMGEFGRSPVKGENHYPRAWTTVLAGGGLRTGRVVGKTDEKGKQPGGTVVERPISAADFFATICKALGIDPQKEVMAPGDRPMRLVEKTARAIDELLA
jgi:uncharacterized protein (DUF1501 family)